MANLAQARDALAAARLPLLDGGVTSLLDPFKGVDALPLALAAAPALSPSGLPAALLVLRASALLKPPPSPAWKRAWELAAAITLPLAGMDVLAAPHLLHVWRTKGMPGPHAPAPDAAALLRAVDAQVSSTPVEVACAAACLAGQPAQSSVARGSLMDRMDKGSLDGWEAVLVMEAALHGGLGPQDRFTRRAREYLAARQDAASGRWECRSGAGHTHEATFLALVLLMRGG